MRGIDESDPESIEIANVRIDPESDGPHWRSLNKKKWLAEAKQNVRSIIDDNGVEAAVDNEELEIVAK